MFSVAPAVLEKVPVESVNVLPDATLQTWLPAPRVRLEAISRLAVALVMSMPLVPRVSVFAPVIVTLPAGVETAIPPHERLDPSAVEFAEVTVESQVATSKVPGTKPPNQLEPKNKSSGLSNFTLVAADA